MDDNDSHSSQRFPIDVTQLLQRIQSGASIPWKTIRSHEFHWAGNTGQWDQPGEVSLLTYFRPRWVREDLVLNSERKLFPVNLLLDLQRIGFSLVFINSGHSDYIPKLTGLQLSAFERKGLKGSKWKTHAQRMGTLVSTSLITSLQQILWTGVRTGK